MIPLFRPWVGEDEIDAIRHVIESGWLGMGPKTEEFENELSKYVDAKYAVGLNSATAALDLSVKALGINSGEILVPSLTFVSTANVALYNNAKPVFVDVNEDTLCMDVEDLNEKINENTRAIIPVHYGGHPCDMDEIIKLAESKNIPVIEDAAHAAGSEYKNRKIGSISDITCFSFHPVKNIATGDGGMITTNNEYLFEKIRKLRWFCISKSTFKRTRAEGYTWHYEIDGLGYKLHMNDITAAIGLVQLWKLEKANEIRRKIVGRYIRELSGLEAVILPKEKSYVKSSCHMFVLKVENRDGLIEHLERNGISAGVHYLPIHLHPYYVGLIKSGSIPTPKVPVTENIWKGIVTLPLFPALSDNDVTHIINAVKEFYLE